MLGNYDRFGWCHVGFGGKHIAKYFKVDSMGSIEENWTPMELGSI